MSITINVNCNSFILAKLATTQQYRSNYGKAAGLEINSLEISLY